MGLLMKMRTTLVSSVQQMIVDDVVGDHQTRYIVRTSEDIRMDTAESMT